MGVEGGALPVVGFAQTCSAVVTEEQRFIVIHHLGAKSRGCNTVGLVNCEEQQTMALKSHHHKDGHMEDSGGKALTTTGNHKGGDQVTLWDPLACDPFDAFGALWQGPLSLFSGFCTPGTRVDWKETAGNHVFKADMPGLIKDDVKVTVEDGNMLQIVGRRREDTEESATWHRVERSQNKFMRRFQLPSDARVDTMKIKVENGVLTIYVPKDKNHKAPTRISKEIPVQWE